jgi:(1->4)-alpha-D-glucan 1-alpha-D-glucosylmutase
MELESIITAIGYLPLRTETEPERVRERHREKSVIRSRLDRLTQECAGSAQAALNAAVQLINGTPGDPRSFDLLETLLSDQAHRLAYWRVAADEINYRRFFDINELAAIRVEDPGGVRCGARAGAGVHPSGMGDRAAHRSP